MNGLLGYLKKKLGREVDETQVRMMSPLVLAYIGDTVYDLFVRTYLLILYNVPVHQLHVKAIDFVKAKAQADTLHRIEEFLTPEEQEVVRRGRNAKPGSVPKNADIMEYRWATGFESLFGYLYLLDKNERLFDILDYLLDSAKGEKVNG